MTKTNLEKSMEQLLNLPSETTSIKDKIVPQKQNQEILPPADEDRAEEDYKYARENLKGIIENGNMALQELTSIASTSESPRAFEVVAQMVKNLADVNKDLLEIQRKLKTLKDGEQKDPKNVTNALFVGSTAELQKIIKGDK